MLSQLAKTPRKETADVGPVNEDLHWSLGLSLTFWGLVRLVCFV